MGAEFAVPTLSPWRDLELPLRELKPPGLEFTSEIRLVEEEKLEWDVSFISLKSSMRELTLIDFLKLFAQMYFQDIFKLSLT